MGNKKFLFIGIVILLSIIGLTGCSGVSAKTTSSTAAPLNVNLNGQQGIWVNGEGKVTVTPDIAILTFGVSAQAIKVADAQIQAAAAMEMVMNNLKNNGIDSKDIQTQNYNITPLYDYNKTGIITPGIGGAPEPLIPPPTPNNTVTGYQVDNMVTVKIRAVDKAGTIIDAVTAAGGDLVRVNGIYFSIDQPDKYYPQARTLAMNDAKDKAENLASLAGVKLGPAIYISENSNSQPVGYPVPVYKTMDSTGSATTSISPGQSDITLDVQVNYAIQ